MARFRQVQASFVSGALDPSMRGRVDTEIYTKAANKLNNVYIRPQGGAVRREGLQYWDATTSNQEARLIEFEFNNIQTYILVFTPGEFKVYRTDVVGTVQATVTSSPISGLTAAQIKEMTFTQSADTLILFHKDVQPIKITRTGHTSWTASSITFTNIPPHNYGSLTTTNPTGSITPDVTTGQVTVAGAGTNFTSSYVGQFLNLPKGGRILVKTVNSTTELEGVVRVELANTSSVATGDWELESGYEDVMSASRGWVSAGIFFKSRLWLGNVGERPQTILASKVGSFFDFDIGSALDDEAINITIDDDRVNTIKHFFSGRGLQIFTSGGEVSIRSQINEPITPSSIAGLLTKETLHGISDVKPISVDGTTVFVESGGAVIRQFIFNDVEQSFKAPNISITSQHLLKSPVAMDVRRSTDEEPSTYLYVVNNNGTVAVLNQLREQDLTAWSSFSTEGTFEDVAVSGRKTFFIVKRTINGSTVRYIEMLNPDHFMDASTLQTSGTATTSWSNLAYFNGEEVTVRGNDFILDKETVSAGSITTSKIVSKMEAGLSYFAEVEPLPLDVIVGGQSFAGEWKSLQKLNIQVLDSRNIIVVISGKTTKPAFRSFGADILDNPVKLFTGWKQILAGGIKRDTVVSITQEQPLEFKILSYSYTLRL